MQINLFQNTQNVNNYPKIGEKRSYSTPVSFCGADVFEKAAVKFSKELCTETVNKFLEKFAEHESGQCCTMEEMIQRQKIVETVVNEVAEINF